MKIKKEHPILFLFIVIFLILVYIDKEAVINFVANLWDCLIPFFYSIVIVYLLTPIIKIITKQLNKYTKLSRKNIKIISVISAYIVFVFLVAMFILSIVPVLRDNIVHMIDNFPNLESTIIANVDEIGQYINLQNISDVELFVNSLIEKYLSLDTFSSILPYLNDSISIVLNFFYNAAVAFIISLYLVFETDKLIYFCKKAYRAFFGQRRYNISKLIFKDSYKMFNTYMISKIKDSAIVGILLFIIMKIMGLDYSILLSIVVAITNMIPYIGPFIGGALGFVLFLSVSLKDALIFLAIIVILQQLDCWIIGVIVVEKDTKMSPLLILMSVIIGGALFGWIGMLIGTPVAQIIQYILNLMIQTEEMKNDWKEKDL